MPDVRVIRADIPGLDISTAATPDGTIWLVVGRDAPRPHWSCAYALEDIVGGLPGSLTYEGDAPPPGPGCRLRLVA